MKSAIFLLSASLAFVSAAPQVGPAVTETVAIEQGDPAPTCGPCLNSCIIACPPKKVCICPAVCDPKFECKLTKRAVAAIAATTTVTKWTTLPTLTVTPRLTDIITSKNPTWPTKTSVIPLPTVITSVIPLPTVITSVKPLPSVIKAAEAEKERIQVDKREEVVPLPSVIPCGCLNDCVVNCPPGQVCKCTKECDPKYRCEKTVTVTSTTAWKTLTLDPIVTGQPVIEY